MARRVTFVDGQPVFVDDPAPVRTASGGTATVPYDPESNIYGTGVGTGDPIKNTEWDPNMAARTQMRYNDLANAFMRTFGQGGVAVSSLRPGGKDMSTEQVGIDILNRLVNPTKQDTLTRAATDMAQSGIAGDYRIRQQLLREGGADNPMQAAMMSNQLGLQAREQMSQLDLQNRLAQRQADIQNLFSLIGSNQHQANIMSGMTIPSVNKGNALGSILGSAAQVGAAFIPGVG